MSDTEAEPTEAERSKTLVKATIDDPENTTECPLCAADSKIIDKDVMTMFSCGTFVNLVTFEGSNEDGDDHLQKGAVVMGTMCDLRMENQELKYALNHCLDRLAEVQFEPTLNTIEYRKLAADGA